VGRTRLRRPVAVVTDPRALALDLRLSPSPKGSPASAETRPPSRETHTGRPGRGA
jgi:hypothetical protein